MKKSPSQGGCWFCHDDAAEMLFSTEFDCFLHLDCLKRELSDDRSEPSPEARIMGRELLEGKVTWHDDNGEDGLED